jgi:hypothetical protein
VAKPPLGLQPGLDYTVSQLPHEESNYERFVELSLRYQPDVLLYYTHYADASHHLNWKADTLGDSLFHLGLSHRDFDPGEAISYSYRQIDRFLLDILDRLPPDAIVALVSDHGFDLRGYEHDNAPPGVIIVRGPGARPGPVAGARIHDVTPTLLHLLGLPVADDMDGVVLSLAEPSGPLDRPVERVASYGPAATPAEAGQIDPKDLEEHEDYLKALGYMN